MNLISIANLVASNKCVVQSKAMIDIADLQRGLYVFDSTG